MSAERYPRLSVTVSLFTTVEAGPWTQSPVGASTISTGDPEEREFGLGLFALTRTTNNDSAGPAKRVLPATFVEPHERVQDAARRLLAQELGITRLGILRETGMFDAVDREGDDRVISVAYWAFAEFEDIAAVLGGRDRVGLELVTSSEFIDRWGDEQHLEDFDGVSRFGHRLMPSPERGHVKVLSSQMWGETILESDHDDMVFYSWRAMRHGFLGQLDPFRFLGTQALPETFSLSELRDFHDVCRGERNQPDQFRRYVSKGESFIRRLEQTTSSSDDKPSRRGKPANLYTLQDWARPHSENDADGA